MYVNNCPRLIEKMIKNGHRFVSPRITLYNYIPLGIYKTQSYKMNNIERAMIGKIKNITTQKSIRIGDNFNIEFGQYINHSFDPNVKVLNNK